ncbi:MAG: response regulator [Candidatus Omnitrophica bacterium]|nr:response regulator [Candidatus Omnitrophota bacterium]
MAKKILVVDDDPDLVEVLSKRLKSNHYQVVTAYDSEEGLEKAKTESPDLIILDVMMPGMDGSAMAAVLREDSKTHNIPVIFLTGIVEKMEEQQQGHQIGGNIFVAKPFEAKELLEIKKKKLEEQGG